MKTLPYLTEDYIFRNTQSPVPFNYEVFHALQLRHRRSLNDYESVIALYSKLWPPYADMVEQVENVHRLPERHKIVQSNDVNSCLRYISFNRNLHGYYVAQAHFRSQNSRMREADEWFIAGLTERLQLPVTAWVNLIVDEFLEEIGDNNNEENSNSLSSFNANYISCMPL